MRLLAACLLLFLAVLLILPRLGQDREPLFIDVYPTESEPEAGPAAWPRGAVSRHNVDRIPYFVCDRVFRPLAPGQVEPIPETHT